MKKPEFTNLSRGIVIAADVNTLEALRFLSTIACKIETVAAIKIGYSLGLRFGLGVVTRAIRESSSLPIIYDHQKAGTDIPQMGLSFAQICSDFGLTAMIIFPMSGPRTLEGFARAAFDKGVEPIVGLAMTHQSYLASEGGYICEDAPERICSDAIALGVDSFVMPATKPSLTRRLTDQFVQPLKGAKILMPGVGRQGGSVRDSVVMAPGKRVFPIIG